jgi:hypothetical protein
VDAGGFNRIMPALHGAEETASQEMMKRKIKARHC